MVLVSHLPLLCSAGSGAFPVGNLNVGIAFYTVTVDEFVLMQLLQQSVTIDIIKRQHHGFNFLRAVIGRPSLSAIVHKPAKRMRASGWHSASSSFVKKRLNVS